MKQGLKRGSCIARHSVFDAKGLGQVGVPMQLWASALGGSGVTLQSVEVLRQEPAESSASLGALAADTAVTRTS